MGIGPQVGDITELTWVHENRREHDVAARLGLVEQRGVTGVQRAHRGNETHRVTGVALSLGVVAPGRDGVEALHVRRFLTSGARRARRPRERARRRSNAPPRE